MNSNLLEILTAGLLLLSAYLYLFVVSVNKSLTIIFVSTYSTILLEVILNVSFSYAAREKIFK